MPTELLYIQFESNIKLWKFHFVFIERALSVMILSRDFVCFQIKYPISFCSVERNRREKLRTMNADSLIDAWNIYRERVESFKSEWKLLKNE